MILNIRNVKRKGRNVSAILARIVRGWKINTIVLLEPAALKSQASKVMTSYTFVLKD